MRPTDSIALPFLAISALVTALATADVASSLANAATRQPSTPHENIALARWREAFEKRDGDVKVVIEFGD